MKDNLIRLLPQNPHYLYIVLKHTKCAECWIYNLPNSVPQTLKLGFAVEPWTLYSVSNTIHIWPSTNHGWATRLTCYRCNDTSSDPRAHRPCNGRSRSTRCDWARRQDDTGFSLHDLEKKLMLYCWSQWSDFIIYLLTDFCYTPFHVNTTKASAVNVI